MVEWAALIVKVTAPSLCESVSMTTALNTDAEHFFVSYSRQDSAAVDRVVARIRQSDIRFWIDTESIEKSDDWWQSICHGIRSSEAVIVFLSAAYLDSSVCRNELEYALEAGKRVVSVALTSHSGLETAPEWIKAINWVDGAGVEGEVLAREIARVAGLDHEWTGLPRVWLTSHLWGVALRKDGCHAQEVPC